MQSVTHIIHCWLDVDNLLGVSKKQFMGRVKSVDWVKKRAHIFKNFTEKSLLNQTFKDFRIFLFCSPKRRNITEEFGFDKKVETVYDFGKSRYLDEINTDYVTVTRIDSDDLFHKDVMDEIQRKAQYKGSRMSLIYRHVIQWNLYWNFISDFFLPVSPFASHVFPKKEYKNWEYFSKAQFSGYRTIKEELTRKRVCIIRHDDNVTWTRIGKNPRGRKYFQEERRKRNNFIVDENDMRKILSDFGINKEKISWKQILK